MSKTAEARETAVEKDKPDAESPQSGPDHERLEYLVKVLLAWSPPES